MANWLIDFDSTLADTMGGLFRLCNERFGTAYVPEQHASWFLEDFMPADHAAFLWGEEGFLSPAAQLSLPPVPGAVEMAKLLDRIGEVPFVVSDRPDRLYEVTRRWLAKHGLADVPLIFTRHPATTVSDCGGAWTKADACREYGLTRVVEDAPHHAATLAAEPQIERVYLLDMPYNREVAAPKVKRAGDWIEIAADYLTGKFFRECGA